MGRNVDVKVRVDDPGTLRRRAEEVADTGPELIVQDDLFFPAARGRLKLRRFAEGGGELIAYERSDAARPRESSYLIHPTDRPDELGAALERALGTAGRVRKRRTLFLAGQTRIHLDDVEGLGHFLELEVVLRAEQSEEEGIGICRDLLDRLGIDDAAHVPVAYVDLFEDAGDGA